MSLTRRSLLAAAAMAGTTAPAWAAGFPDKNVTFIIPYAPGGGFDAYVRAIVPAFEARLAGHHQVLPDNVVGAGGAKAANMIYRARPDGYTVSAINMPGLLILQMRGGAVGFDVMKLSWIGNMGRDPYGLVVSAKSPIHSIEELQALARKRPIKMPSTGTASTAYNATRIAGRLLDLNVQIIGGYRGTNDYLVGTIRGDGDAAIASLTAIDKFRKGGLVRVLAAFEPHSSIPGAADATTLKQPDLSKILQLRPVAGPPGIPKAVVHDLSTALYGAIKDPKVQAWAKQNDANLDPETAEATEALMREQATFLAAWRKELKS